MKKHIKINPLFFLTLPIVYFSGIIYEYILMFLILSIHEISHLIAISFEDIKISFIKLEPFGITIRLKDHMADNPKKEIIMAIAGPIANFILAFIAYITYCEELKFFMLANISMGIFNLLPVYPLDGGRIFKAVLSQKYGYIKTYRFILKISALFSVMIIIFGIYIIFITDFNFSVCITGCFLCFNILTERNYSYYLAKEISEYKRKNKNIEKMPVIHIAVNKNFPVRKILNDLSFTKYYIFSVIDNGKNVAQLTEGELIEGLITKKAGIKIKDLI